MSSSTTFCVATGRGGEGRGGRSLLAARPCEAAGSDQTSSSLPLPARLPSKSLDTSLSSVCLFSFSTSFKPSPLYSSSSSLYLPLPLTPSPRSYSQSAVPALLLLLLRGWSAAVRRCSASCWQKPSVGRCGFRTAPSRRACPWRARGRSSVRGRGRGLASGGSSSWSCGGGPWPAWRRCSAATGPSGGGWAGPWWAPSRCLLLCRRRLSDPSPAAGPPDGQVRPGASRGTWNKKLDYPPWY